MTGGRKSSFFVLLLLVAQAPFLCASSARCAHGGRLSHNLVALSAFVACVPCTTNTRWHTAAANRNGQGYFLTSFRSNSQCCGVGQEDYTLDSRFFRRRNAVHGVSTSTVCHAAHGAPGGTEASSIAERLLHRVRGVDRAGAAARSALPFVVGGKTMGRVLPQVAAVLSQYPDVFRVTNDAVRLIDEASESNGNEDDLVASRSERVNQVMLSLRDKDTVPALRGWRGEAFAVRESFNAPPLLIVERAAAVLFGVAAYGVFLNGYTCEGTSKHTPTHLWVGKRAANKPTWPGRLDSIVAGGLAAGMLPLEAMLKECEEEAGISAALASEVRAVSASEVRAVSAVSYTGFSEDGWGCKRDTLFCFDLALPSDFEPQAADGEMECFRKLTVAEVRDMLAMHVGEDDAGNTWKPNVGVVLVDFLVRHGIVEANDASFLPLVHALRVCGGS